MRKPKASKEESKTRFDKEIVRILKTISDRSFKLWTTGIRRKNNIRKKEGGGEGGKCFTLSC